MMITQEGVLKNSNILDIGRTGSKQGHLVENLDNPLCLALFEKCYTYLELLSHILTIHSAAHDMNMSGMKLFHSMLYTGMLWAENVFKKLQHIDRLKPILTKTILNIRGVFI